uniref:Uncharacterized protein n=1 Tax=Setaria italica TaxID=4555 RepID=K3YAW3_SETIT
MGFVKMKLGKHNKFRDVFEMAFNVSKDQDKFCKTQPVSQKFPDRWIEERGSSYAVRYLREILTRRGQKMYHVPSTGNVAPYHEPGDKGCNTSISVTRVSTRGYAGSRWHIGLGSQHSDIAK